MKFSKSNRLYFKIIFILFLVVLLLVPNGMLKSLIYERQNLQESTENEIAASWGKDQKINGVIITIPYNTKITDSNGKDFYNDFELHIVPETMNIDINLISNKKKRGIYEAILYTAKLNMEGSFNFHKIKKKLNHAHEIKWENAQVCVAISNSESIQENIIANFGTQKLIFEPGTNQNYMFPSGGVNSKIKINPEKEKYEFKFNTTLRGSRSFQLLPLAEETQVKISSDWHSPSFVGDHLPMHEITEQGFTSQWKLSKFNRNIPLVWKNNDQQVEKSKGIFGVKLLQPVDQYQKNMRSAKYASMIIFLTFLIYFFFEMLNQIRIHPIQYAMVGIALTLFYFLLLSLSEHISFNYAYLISSGAVIGLIAFYSSFIFKKKTYAGILLIILILLYAYIFVLLQLEVFALLAGSIGLFTILAIVMYLSRNVNWYDLGDININEGK